MSRIFWDSNLFIYLFENHPDFGQMVEDLRQNMLDRGDQLYTSTLTLGEILVKPMALGDEVLCKQYERIVSSSAVIIPFDLKASRRYAAIRSSTHSKGPDAIQLACASAVGVDLFITNDGHLQGQRVEGIQFIVPLSRVPF